MPTKKTHLVGLTPKARFYLYHVKPASKPDVKNRNRIDEVRCKYCPDKFYNTKYSTAGIEHHLRTVHHITIPSFQPGRKPKEAQLGGQ